MSYKEKNEEEKITYLVCSSFWVAFNSLEKNFCSTTNQEILYLKISELLAYNPTPLPISVFPLPLDFPGGK